MPRRLRTPTEHLAPCRCPTIGFLSLPTPHGSSALSNSHANNDIANRAAPATPHSTAIHHRSPPTASPQSPLRTTSRCNIPEETLPLRPYSHRPRPPRTGQKQSNHTFPVSGSRGCVCLSGGSRECVRDIRPNGSRPQA